MKRALLSACLAAATAFTGSVVAQDGMNIGSEYSLLFTQDTPTGFGNATGGLQDSAGGSEINSLWGTYENGTLKFSIAGNLEGNFNKFFIFFDGAAGGENVLLNDNIDGGFNEIQSLAGLTFDSGFTADHGLRIEVGGGFVGVNQFNLIDNTASNVWSSGAGFGALPANTVGNGVVTFGWDNSNVLGVDGASAAAALTATQGWEFEIDVASFFGGVFQDIGIAGFITSGDGQFLSNQVIGGIGGAGNLGDPTVVDFNTIGGNQFVTVSIPEPASAGLLLAAGIFGALRRRRS